MNSEDNIINNNDVENNIIEGRNAVIEAFRSGKTVDKVLILEGCQDGPINTIIREAKKHNVLIKYVKQDRLDKASETGKHQGVIAYVAAYKYAEVEDILENARKKGAIAIEDKYGRSNGDVLCKIRSLK